MSLVKRPHLTTSFISKALGWREAQLGVSVILCWKILDNYENPCYRVACSNYGWRIQNTEMTRNRKEQNETRQEAPVCTHYWVIEAASGPTSRGVCKLCGAVKEFKNYVEHSVWHDTGPEPEDELALVGISREALQTSYEE